MLLRGQRNEKDSLFHILIASRWAGVFAGCRSGSQIEIRLAPIHEVRVSIAEFFPPQVFVYIKGGLADSCTTFHDLTVNRDGNTVNIEVTTQRPKKATCLEVYGYFEKNVNLGSQFVAKQTYNLKVDD